MDKTLPSGKPVTPILSAALIDKYRYRYRSALVGVRNAKKGGGLFIAFSNDGRDWDWEKKPILSWRQEDLTKPTIEMAYRRGTNIVVMLRKTIDKRIQHDIAILDAERPWQLIEYFQDVGNKPPSESPHHDYWQQPSLQLERYAYNPIISPHLEHPWEAFTTLNPAAFLLEGRVHLLYRAQGFDYVSTLGYAISNDGLAIDERMNQPVYQDVRLEEAAHGGYATSTYTSGGGLGGVEDPRAVVFENKVHMTYVAYNGMSPPRLAYTSIPVEDFLKRYFHWDNPVYMSPPDRVDKSGVIFPRKIKGKYVVMHRIFPDIQLNYRDNLKFGEGHYLEVDDVIPVSSYGWDSRKIGAGPPPLELDDAWLLIYYGVDDQIDSEYHIGAMLLDKENPAKVLCRSKEAILSPAAPYEVTGFKPGILYPCGAVIKEKTLYVYYGAADQHVGVATISVNRLVETLKRDTRPLQGPRKNKRLNKPPTHEVLH